MDLGERVSVEGHSPRGDVCGGGCSLSWCNVATPPKTPKVSAWLHQGERHTLEEMSWRKVGSKVDKGEGKREKIVKWSHIAVIRRTILKMPFVIVRTHCCLWGESKLQWNWRAFLFPSAEPLLNYLCLMRCLMSTSVSKTEDGANFWAGEVWTKPCSIAFLLWLETHLNMRKECLKTGNRWIN